MVLGALRGIPQTSELAVVVAVPSDMPAEVGAGGAR
jgi:hypothetical protein